MQSRNSLPGVASSLGASVLFATLYYYTSLLEPLGGQQIYGWRILLTAPCLALLLLGFARWGEVRQILARLSEEPRLLLVLPLSSALVGVQLWLFMWAPINGHGLDVSLGYFLLPLTLVLTGRLLFGEAISRLQGLACLLARLASATSCCWPRPCPGRCWRLPSVIPATLPCAAGPVPPTSAACCSISASACRSPPPLPWPMATPCSMLSKARGCFC